MNCGCESECKLEFSACAVCLYVWLRMHANDLVNVSQSESANKTNIQQTSSELVNFLLSESCTFLHGLVSTCIHGLDSLHASLKFKYYINCIAMNLFEQSQNK